MTNIWKQLGVVLRKYSMTLSCAESCTGGLLGGMITSVSGSSEYFAGGVITYTNHAKIDLIGVDPDILSDKGAVSKEVAKEMARGVAERMSTDVGVGITGIAGPGGGTVSKPVGLVYIGIFIRRRDEEGVSICMEHMFSGDRDAIRNSAVMGACELIMESIR